MFLLSKANFLILLGVITNVLTRDPIFLPSNYLSKFNTENTR